MLNAVLQALTDAEHHQGFWLMIGALAGSASAFVVVTAAIVAVFQLSEARALRRAQVRPFVVIEFHTLLSSRINLRISNLGSTMARNIRFTFDRPLTTTRDDQLADRDDECMCDLERGGRAPDSRPASGEGVDD